MTSPSVWTPDEDRALRIAWEMWNGTGKDFDADHAAATGKPFNAVSHRRRSMKLTRDMPPMPKQSKGVTDDPDGVRAGTIALDRELRRVAEKNGYRLAAWA